MDTLLDRINSPEDLRKLRPEQLPGLCDEIRSFMLDNCSRNPGHLASSLGAVELIVGFHYVFDTPEDKIVFDVGHQAYAHKILTGRREEFRALRRQGGLSGFPKMSESPYDNFGVGHSSTSISAALGLAEASRLLGRSPKAAALIGDGALTGGQAFEGINNASISNADLLVILNDNNQSIDRNIGGLHNHLLRLTTSATYNRVKERVWHSLGETRARNFFQRWIRSLKSWFVKNSGGDLFESLGLRYFGPIDGNDINEVVNAMRKIRNLKGPRLLHCLTVKGKGFSPAEKDPVTWHAPGRFNPETGERIGVQHSRDRYQDVFGQTLLDLAQRDARVVGITPAMATGCGMNLLSEQMPHRFFDVGIEEEHAVTFAAGMAAGGMRPFCNLYSSFAQRAYDQIIHDTALQGLPVILCLDRAGLVGEDGPTHHGAFDMAAFRSIPGTTICAPRNERELRDLMYTGLQQTHGPFIIRYPRGMGEGVAWRGMNFSTLEPGRGEQLSEGSTVAVLTLGPMAGEALKAAGTFPEGTVAVYDMRYLKPLDEDIMAQVSSRFKAVITVEDGAMKGGLYGAVCEALSSEGWCGRVKGIGIPDEFVPHARQEEERKLCGLDAEGIRIEVAKLLKKN